MLHSWVLLEIVKSIKSRIICVPIGLLRQHLHIHIAKWIGEFADIKALDRNIN